MYRIIPKNENPALREISKPLTPEEIASPRIQTLIAEMKTLLAQEKLGVALAAPQVGEAVRLFVVSGAALSRQEDDTAPLLSTKISQADQVYINPEIMRVSRGTKLKHEGCLSVRGTWGMVPRAEKMTVRAKDEYGNTFTRGASGFLAHIFQHEIDHLNAILYIDKAEELFDEETTTSKES